MAISAIVAGSCSEAPTELPEPLNLQMSTRSLEIAAGSRAQIALSNGTNPSLPAGAVVAWSSSAPAVATVDGTGTVSGIAAGTAVITATVTHRSNTASLTADVRVIGPPARMNLRGGSGQSAVVRTQLTQPILVEVADAAGHLLPGITVNFTATDAAGAAYATNTALTNNAGVASLAWTLGQTAGVHTLRAAVAQGTQPSVSVQASATAGAPATAQIAAGNNQTAVVGSPLGTALRVRFVDAFGNPVPNTPVTWTVTPGAGTLTAATTATDDSGHATATWRLGSATGRHTVRATAGAATAEFSATAERMTAAEVQIQNGNLTLTSIGATAQLGATARGAGGQVLTDVTFAWQSLTPEVVQVSGVGVVTAVRNGSSRIVASGDGKADTTTITVHQAAHSITVTPASVTLIVGGSAALSAAAVDAGGTSVSDAQFTWASSNGAVAVVGSAGAVSALTVGQATITASMSGKAASATVTVVSATHSASLAFPARSDTLNALFSQKRIAAVVRNVAGDELPGHTIAYTSSNPTVASVDDQARVTARSVGTARILAQAAGLMDSITVVVRQVPARVVFVENELFMARGTTGRASASVVDAGGSILPDPVVDWSSDATGIATVRDGLVTALQLGSAKITATSGQASASIPVTVVEPEAPPPPPPPPAGPGLQVLAVAELPRDSVDVSMPVVSGRILSVASGGNLQAAFDSAKAGDIIELAAGAVFHGAFVLPAKVGNEWIIIRSSAHASLPPAGQRVGPTDSHLMPKLQGGEANQRVLRLGAGASRYRLIGIEITIAPAITTLNAIVEIGGGTQTAAQTPSHIVIDRSYVHGRPGVSFQRCIMLNSAWSAIVDSYVSECHATGVDSQAIVGWNGPGPYRIQNNHLEGAAENLLFGGAAPSVPGVIPSDIIIRGNYFFKPMHWRNVWTVKNILELKAGQRVLIEGNVLEHVWTDGQIGMAVNFKVDNPGGGCGWCTTTDVTFRDNIIRNAAGGMVVTPELGRIRRVHVYNNLFTQLGQPLGPNGRLFQVVNDVEDLVIQHNTGFGTHSAILSDGPAQTGFVFTDNIVTRGDNGVKGPGATEGTATLSVFSPGYTFVRNAVIGATAASYPSGNFFPASIAAAGFVNPAGGNWALQSSSPLAGLGNGGIDPGIHLPRLLNATATAVTGRP